MLIRVKPAGLSFRGAPPAPAMPTPAPRFPCHHCGKEIGFDAPSGVCSVDCLNAAQGFSRASQAALSPQAAQTHSQRLRDLADAMQEAIQAKLDPAIGRQRLTQRRARIAASMAHDARRMQETQAALRTIADAIDKGALPAALDYVRHRRHVETIVHASRLEAHELAAREALKALASAAPPAPPDPMQRVRELERALIGVPIPGFFPTPRPVIDRMLELLTFFTPPGWKGGLPPGAILEPSAGKGDIADAIRERGWPVHCVEVNSQLCEILAAKGHTYEHRDFLRDNYAYHAIVMNPPFERFADIDHVLHAWSCLRSPGRLVSIVSESPFFRRDEAAESFRTFLDRVGATVEHVEEGAFSGPQSFRQTGVRCRIVVIDKL